MAILKMNNPRIIQSTIVLATTTSFISVEGALSRTRRRGQNISDWQFENFNIRSWDSRVRILRKQSLRSQTLQEKHIFLDQFMAHNGSDFMRSEYLGSNSIEQICKFVSVEEYYTWSSPKKEIYWNSQEVYPEQYSAQKRVELQELKRNDIVYQYMQYDDEDHDEFKQRYDAMKKIKYNHYNQIAKNDEERLISESYESLKKQINQEEKKNNAQADDMKAALKSQGFQNEQNLEALETKAKELNQKFIDEKCAQLIKQQREETLDNASPQNPKNPYYWRAELRQMVVLDRLVANGIQLTLDFYNELYKKTDICFGFDYSTRVYQDNLRRFRNLIENFADQAYDEEEKRQENVSGLFQLKLGNIGLPRYVQNNFLDDEVSKEFLYENCLPRKWIRIRGNGM